LGLKIAGEIAELRGSAPNEENWFLLPDRFSSSSKGRSSRLTWCLADTLFRRPEPSDLISFEKQIVLKALVTCRHQAAGNFWKRDYFFFLTRRVFFAVFFTALFAFFAFLAFLAMLPS
jgi:hypothetical protein